MAPLQLLIADDHPVIFSGLRLLLADDPRFTICAEVMSAETACAATRAQQPEVIITDLVMGGLDGVALIRELLAIKPSALILVYSSHDEMLWARHVLQAGARGFVSKAEPLETIATALATLVEGGIHLSPALRQMWAKDVACQSDEPHDVASLSARELQILTLMGKGHSLQALGQELGLSVKTIGTYRERLKIKLGFDNIRMLDRFAADFTAGTVPAR